MIAFNLKVLRAAKIVKGKIKEEKIKRDNIYLIRISKKTIEINGITKENMIEITSNLINLVLMKEVKIDKNKVLKDMKINKINNMIQLNKKINSDMINNMIEESLNKSLKCKMINRINNNSLSNNRKVYRRCSKEKIINLKVMKIRMKKKIQIFSYKKITRWYNFIFIL